MQYTMATNKKTNNDIQNIVHKTKDGATRTPQNTRMNLGATEGYSDPHPSRYSSCKSGDKS